MSVGKEETKKYFSVRPGASKVLGMGEGHRQVGKFVILF